MAENEEKLDNPAEAQFAIQKVYVKDLSFETPNSPEVFKVEWKPAVDMHLTNEATPLGEHLYDVVLSVTITVKIGDMTVYLIEVNQAGVFYIDKIPDEIIERMLATVCPNILFPFAREAVSDIVTRGGFPQLLLSPVNFDALYLQQKQQQAEQQAESKTTH